MHDFRYVGRKLFCEGVAVEALARKFGTPLYVYSQRTLTRHYQELDRAMSPVEHLVCFAMKSNSNQSVLRTRKSRRRIRHRQRRRITARHRGGRQSTKVHLYRHRKDRR